jgi:hypothetical protein
MATLGLRLVGLSGLASSGKDTVCDHLIKKYTNCKRLALADILRHELVDVFDLEFDKMLSRSKDFDLSPVMWQQMGQHIVERYGKGGNDLMTYRELMQIWATDIRRKEDPNYWLTQWRKQVNKMDNDLCIVCPDIRFNNELQVIMDSGLMIYINSDMPMLTPPHPSEIKLSRWHFEIEGKGLQDVHTMCMQAEEACMYQEFTKSTTRKYL